jgi:type VI secretion system protein ImpL
LASRLENLYEKEVVTLLLDPVTRDIENRLRVISGENAAAHPGSVVAEKKYTNEQYYDALKTYLMLANREHREAPYLNNQLLVHWRDWLEKNRAGDDMERITPMAEQAVQYYVRRLASGSVSAVRNQEKLVAGSRSHLNNVLQKLPAKERIYGEIISHATGKFQAVNLTKALENTDVDLMSGGYAVPAAYTRAAWDGYIKEAIEQASRGGLNDADWVLESDSSQRLRAEDFDKNYAELLAMYKAAYTREWTNFIAGLSINNFRGLDDAIGRVNRLSDMRQSPIRRAFARVAYETAWDNPAILKRKTQPSDEKNIKAEIVNRLLAEGGPPSDAALNQMGELEERFSIFNKMTAERGGEPALTPYLAILSRVKVRLEAIKSSGEPGKTARGFMKGTMESSSELIEGGQLVDGQLLAGTNAELRALLKPILLRPFHASYGAVLPLANSDINQNWQRQVLPYWQLLADKYPFADSGTEAQLSDVTKFLESESGTLNKFINEHLNGLLIRSEHGYIPRRWSNMSVPFTDAFLKMLAQVSDIEEQVFIAGGASRFEIQPVPIPGLSEVVLEVDGQQLRYRNGPQLWSAFQWPSENAAQGVKISAVTFSGASSTVVSKPGRMGWVRLLSEARITQVAPGTTQLTWTVNSPDSKTGGTMEVKFNLRQIAGANPLAMNTLRKLNLPKKIVN